MAYALVVYRGATTTTAKKSKLGSSFKLVVHRVKHLTNSEHRAKRLFDTREIISASNKCLSLTSDSTKYLTPCAISFSSVNKCALK